MQIAVSVLFQSQSNIRKQQASKQATRKLQHRDTFQKLHRLLLCAQPLCYNNISAKSGFLQLHNEVVKNS
ncbi:hypothetical protein XELAEV_18013154mg [Xenopus laevis]|uniref:Uncharacterized protein n=1 Tax=Xenopus laevis TaxID=8355 RepID=A0A974DQV8_XENLA|nr:hypothetical protein XELAEV_18013154mg [Xenopus laevis]